MSGMPLPKAKGYQYHDKKKQRHQKQQQHQQQQQHQERTQAWW